MAYVFEGKPDARQSDDVAMKPSRFRPTYRALTDDEKALHDALKVKAVELEELFNKVKPPAGRQPYQDAPAHGRYHALAMTSLEQSLMWIVKELTS